MLDKLIHHEFKTTSRLFLPMYICLGVITLLLKLSLTFSFGGDSIFANDSSTLLSIVNMLLIMVYVIVLIGIILLTYFIIIRRFYTNMFSDEGYLMFTLPVTTGQLLNSKLIVAFIWQFLMIPATCLSFFLLFMNTEVLREMPYLFSEIRKELHILNISGFHISLLIAEMILAVVVEMCSLILMCYLSMALGHHLLPEHRLLGSILAFLGIYTVESFITSVFSTFAGNVFFNQVEFYSVQDLLSYLNTAMPIGILLTLLLCVVYYLLTHYLLSKKLNLE